MPKTRPLAKPCPFLAQGMTQNESDLIFIFFFHASELTGQDWSGEVMRALVGKETALTALLLSRYLDL